MRKAERLFEVVQLLHPVSFHKHKHVSVLGPRWGLMGNGFESCLGPKRVCWIDVSSGYQLVDRRTYQSANIVLGTQHDQARNG